MFLADDNAVLVGVLDEDKGRLGNAAIWSPDELSRGVAWCSANQIPQPSYGINGPWAGAFVTSVGTDAELMGARFIRIGGVDASITVRSANVVHTQPPALRSLFSNAPHRVFAEINGIEPFPEIPRSESSSTIARVSSRAIREHALNVVEEMAGELASDSSLEEGVRRSGRIALEVVAQLRENLEISLPPEDRLERAWLDVMKAVEALIPDEVKKAWRVVEALGKLYDAYEYPSPPSGL